MPVWFRLVLIFLIIALGFPAQAGKKTYLQLWGRCTATGGAASVASERPPILYPYSGEQESRRYTTCYEGQHGWGAINRGGAQNYCASFDLASYQVSCFGGSVSGPAFFAGFVQQMRASKLTLRGDTLYVEQSPGIMAVPLQSGAMERAIAAARRLTPLADGYAPLPAEGSFRSLSWDDARGIPLIPVTEPSSLPASFSLPPPPSWVALLSRPIIDFPLLGLAAVFAAIAAFGYGSGAQSTGARWPLAVASAAALIGILAASTAADAPTNAVNVANQQLENIRSERAAIERDRAQLRAIVSRNGELVPLDEQAQGRIAALIRPRELRAPSPPAADPVFQAMAGLTPFGVLLLFFTHRFIVGWHVLFVPHPAGKAIEPALRRSDLIHEKHAEIFVAATRPNPAEMVNPPPAYKSWNFAAKARAYTERLREDEELAKAAKARDIARAAQKDAEAKLRAARNKLPWWQRWLWR